MRRKIIAILIALCLSIFCVSTSLSIPKTANAASVSIENSDVMSDLMRSTVNGKPFSLLDYPKNELSDVQIISLYEYGYSTDKLKQSDYSLYVYVYNPKQTNFVTSHNQIQLGVNYDSKNNVTSWHKFNLKYVSRSTGDRNNLFYKFKVIDEKIDGTTFLDRVDARERRYDVSGIELKTKGNQNATEYAVGGTYLYTGYMEGYGESQESTLKSEVVETEYIKLDVHNTNYRTGLSNLGNYHYNEVNSVYFSLPKRFFNEYGNLTSITAEWYEFKTRMAVITSNEDFYKQMKEYQYTSVGWKNTSVPFTLQSMDRIQDETSVFHNWVYNNFIQQQFLWVTSSNSRYWQTNLPYVYHSPAVLSETTIFNFLSQPIAGKVNSTEIKETIYNYTSNCTGEYYEVKDRQFSKDLFMDVVDDGRTQGYNHKEIAFDDTFDLESYDSKYSWFFKLLDFGFSWPTNTNEGYADVQPIYLVQEQDVRGYNVSSKLLVNSNKIDEFISFYDQEKLLGNDVVLFRFANTDYYCSPVMENNHTYIAQQTVFLDFDVIELTFSRDGKSIVIPAVMSPIDIVNDFEDLNDYGGCLDDLIGTLGLIFGVAVVIVVTFLIIRLVDNIRSKSVIRELKKDKSKRYKRRHRR